MSVRGTGWRSLLVLILFALVVRSICLLRAPLIGTDASRFLAAAANIEEGNFYGALIDPYHPFTAYLIAQANRVQAAILGNPETVRQDQRRRERAAYIVTLVAGIAVVLLVLDLSRRHFPGVPPLASGILAAVQPYLVRSSADIMSDTIFLAFFLLALREGSRALVGARFSAVSAGGAAGLSYLTRPEGVILLPVLIAVWVLHRPRSVLRWCAQSGAVVASSALLIVPYMYALYTICGQWTLTLKKDVESMLNFTTGSLSPEMDVLFAGLGSTSALESFGTIFHRWLTTGPEMLSVAALIGSFFILKRREWKIGQTLFALTAAAQVAVLLRLAAFVGSGYISRRHVFIMVVIALPFSARGIWEVGSRLGRPLLRGRWEGRGEWVLLAIMVVALLPKTLAAQRQDQLAQLEAGRWILDEYGPQQVFLTSREKVAYYAGGVCRPFPADPSWIVTLLEAESRAWLVFYEESIERYCPGLLERIETNPPKYLRRVRVFEERESRRPRHLHVYRWERPDSDQR